jgi:cysteinyl-tRNA synthetase
MKLFNARTQQLEPFQPFGDEVTLYACGIGVQDTLYLDKAFTYGVSDMLGRYLELKGKRVRFGLCVEEIGQDILPEAEEMDGGVLSVENRWPSPIAEDMESLNMRPPDIVLLSAGKCSEMVSQFLGQTLDIHLSISEPSFGKHQCNLVQVELSDSQEPSVRFRLETALVEDEAQGMDNSGRDRIVIGDLLKRLSPDALRIYLAQHHYRRPWKHNRLALERATRWVAKLNAAMAAVSRGEKKINITPAQNRFTAAMDNDLDTAKGIATLLNLADEIIFRAPNGYRIDEAQATLERMASVFGLRLDKAVVENHILAGAHPEGTPAN